MEHWHELTPRQQDVLIALYEQNGAAHFAASVLGISYYTVKHIQNDAYNRLGTSGLIDTYKMLGWLVIPDVLLDPDTELP